MGGGESGLVVLARVVDSVGGRRWSVLVRGGGGWLRGWWWVGIGEWVLKGGCMGGGGGGRVGGFQWW